MIYAVIIADDLTGAMDSAVHFAVRGFSTQVLTGLSEEKDGRETENAPAASGESWLETGAQVVAVNANTRHLPADEAYRIVYDLAERAGKAGVLCIYKKTDSALRGNVGAELSAMRHALGLEILPFIPAYPRLGRTVVEGRLLINGIPAARTALGSDPIDPLTSSQVRAILENTAPEDEAAHIRVFDAASREDLVRIAGALGDGLSVCAGCGGFAEVLAEKLAPEETKGKKDRKGPGDPGISGEETPKEKTAGEGSSGEEIPKEIISGEGNSGEGITEEKKPEAGIPEGGMLLICGSLHENSLMQVEEAKRHGHPAFVIPEKVLTEETPTRKSRKGEELRAESGVNSCENFCRLSQKITDQRLNEDGCVFVKRISEELRCRRLCILTTTDPAKPSPDMRRRESVQAGVGQVARAICDTGCASSLCIFGGDTLLAVMRALRADLIRIRREVQPGVILGSIVYRGRDLPVITKAGSFGEADLIEKLPGMGR